MMKMNVNVKLWTLVLPCVFVLTAPGFAEEKNANPTQTQTDETKKQEKKAPTKEELFSAQNISKLSETYGHLIQKGLDNPVLKLDFDAVIKGMQDGKAGKPAPMSEQEYEESINQLQEFAYQDLASRNLQEADKFLKDNAKKDGVKEIEPGKLQYLVLKQGNGEVVTEEMRPMIKYSGQYLDGTVFGSSDAGSGPIAISLKQTIPGFRKGVLGMKVGEKRRIFIHPELGYGTSGQLLPNALLIFEIEVTDVKPEPKETSKEGDAGVDGMQQLAAENLFPDELDERDDFDDDDDEDGQDEADEDEDDDDDDDIAEGDFNPQVTRDAIESKEPEQNDLRQQKGNAQSEQMRMERAKERARLQNEREAKLKQQQQEAQKKQQAQPQAAAKGAQEKDQKVAQTKSASGQEKAAQDKSQVKPQANTAQEKADPNSKAAANTSNKSQQSASTAQAKVANTKK